MCCYVCDEALARYACQDNPSLIQSHLLVGYIDEKLNSSWFAGHPYFLYCLTYCVRI